MSPGSYCPVAQLMELEIQALCTEAEGEKNLTLSA